MVFIKCYNNIICNNVRTNGKGIWFKYKVYKSPDALKMEVWNEFRTKYEGGGTYSMIEKGGVAFSNVVGVNFSEVSGKFA